MLVKKHSKVHFSLQPSRTSSKGDDSKGAQNTHYACLLRASFPFFSPMSVDITLTPISSSPGIHIVCYVLE